MTGKFNKRYNKFDFQENFFYYYDYSHDPFTPPLRITSAGNSIWSRGYSCKRTASEIFGIEMITKGNAVFIQEGREYLVSAGEVYLLRRGGDHVYKVGPAGFLHKRFCVIEGGGLEPLLRAMNLFECDVVHPLTPRNVVILMRRIHRVLKEKMSGFTTELSSLAYSLLLELGRSLTVQYPETIRVAIEFIQQHLDQPLEYDQIRERAGLSTTHFNRLFRNFTGVSPMHFFISQRISWAQHLLSQTSMSVKEIASAVGFDDPLYFSARFKKYTGFSPRYFRMRKTDT
jgi:AraC-like DNA-binding protein